MSRFKELYQTDTSADKLGDILKERVIDTTNVVRLAKMKTETDKPFLVEVARKNLGDGSISYRNMDFSTLQEAERFMSRVV